MSEPKGIVTAELDFGASFEVGEFARQMAGCDEEAYYRYLIDQLRKKPWTPGAWNLLATVVCPCFTATTIGRPKSCQSPAKKGLPYDHARRSEFPRYARSRTSSFDLGLVPSSVRLGNRRHDREGRHPRTRS